MESCQLDLLLKRNQIAYQIVKISIKSFEKKFCIFEWTNSKSVLRIRNRNIVAPEQILYDTQTEKMVWLKIIFHHVYRARF